jgi:hypothetical protein
MLPDLADERVVHVQAGRRQVLAEVAVGQHAAQPLCQASRSSRWKAYTAWLSPPWCLPSPM